MVKFSFPLFIYEFGVSKRGERVKVVNEVATLLFISSGTINTTARPTPRASSRPTRVGPPHDQFV